MAFLEKKRFRIFCRNSSFVNKKENSNDSSSVNVFGSNKTIIGKILETKIKDFPRVEHKRRKPPTPNAFSPISSQGFWNMKMSLNRWSQDGNSSTEPSSKIKNRYQENKLKSDFHKILRRSIMSSLNSTLPSTSVDFQHLEEC